MKIRPEIWILLTYLAGVILFFQPLLAHDALHNYGYLHSMVFQGDLDLADEFLLRNSHHMYVPGPREAPVNLGLSLLGAPFLLPAAIQTLLSGLGGGAPLWDGYSPLFTLWYAAGFCAWGLTALLLLYRALASWAGPGPALAASLLAFWASPAPAYAFLWPGFHHLPSMALAAIILMLCEDWEGFGRPWDLLGFLLGLGALIWPPNLLLLFPVLIRGGRPRGREGLFFLTTLLAGALPQLVVQGAWGRRFAINPYAERGDAFAPDLSSLPGLFFGPDHGLIPFHPGVLVLAPIAAWGLIWDPKRFRSWLAPVLGLVLILLCYSGRSGGAAFGARYFLFLVPFGAAALAWAFSRLSRPWAWLLSLPLAGAVLLNIGMLVLFRKEILPHFGPAEIQGLYGRAFSLGWTQIGSLWEADRQNLSLFGGAFEMLKRGGGPAALFIAAAALAFIGLLAPALARALAAGLGRESRSGLAALASSWALLGLLLLPASYEAGKLPPALSLFQGDDYLAPGQSRSYGPASEAGAQRVSLVLGGDWGVRPPDPGSLRLELLGRRGTWSGTGWGRPLRTVQWMPSLSPTELAGAKLGYLLRIDLPLDVGRVESLKLRNISKQDGLWLRALSLD